jgi:hypothetical protein
VRAEIAEMDELHDQQGRNTASEAIASAPVKKTPSMATTRIFISMRFASGC